MKFIKASFLLILPSLIFFSCKKDDDNAGSANTTPVGYFKGTYTIAPSTTGNVFFLLRSNNTGREYSGSTTATDSATMSKREIVWSYSGTALEIKNAQSMGYVYRATVAPPINTIAGTEGIISLGTYQVTGSFSVTR